ncbi:MAG: hypothetical protein ACHQRM_18195 [Bacteroidia bacterium]
MEIVLQSLTSLHDKIESYNEKCGPCKKDILLEADKIATAKAKSENKTIKIYVLATGITILLALLGFKTYDFLKTPAQVKAAHATEERNP